MVELVTREDAMKALKEAVEKDEARWIYFWTGYLLGLPNEEGKR